MRMKELWLEIQELRAQGLSDEEIAKRLHIPVEMVKSVNRGG